MLRQQKAVSQKLRRDGADCNGFLKMTLKFEHTALVGKKHNYVEVEIKHFQVGFYNCNYSVLAQKIQQTKMDINILSL